MNNEQETKNLLPTWEEIASAEGGKIFKDSFDEGIRFIIMKGDSSLCAYIGIPEDHPLAGFAYDSIPITAHGGLTFAGNGKYWPKGFYFYGWDYAHSGDYCDHYDRPPLATSLMRTNDKKWLVKDVEEDSQETIWQFRSLMKLAERIAEKINVNPQTPTS